MQLENKAGQWKVFVPEFPSKEEAHELYGEHVYQKHTKSQLIAMAESRAKAVLAADKNSLAWGDEIENLQAEIYQLKEDNEKANDKFNRTADAARALLEAAIGDLDFGNSA